jgi:hypothetical protein
MQNPIAGLAGLTALAILVGATGCRVHVEKGASGEDKNVQVDTPFGGVHVNTDQTSAADLGLPAYPGSQIVTDKDNDKSADIHLGFGEWQLRVKAVNYATADSQDKVIAYYKQALGRYGDVILCQDDKPVGKPDVTTEGLTCTNSGKNGVNVKVGGDDWKKDLDEVQGDDGLQLKAGSQHHQHIIGFDKPVGGQTRFSLVAIDLPSGVGSSEHKD